MWERLRNSGVDTEYRLDVNPKLGKKLPKLTPWQIDAIDSKTVEILRHPHHFKNLRGAQKHLKRVHINSHFVLLFSVDEQNKIVRLEDFLHHDEAYR